MKKIYRVFCSMLLIGSLCMGYALPVQAAQVQNGAVYSIETNQIAEWPQAIDVYSETAVLMDAETGMILYNKGMDEIRYPASITKIMTALLALERCSLEEQVVFTEECLADQTPDSRHISMKVGEILTMEQCISAMMVQSANDVSTQIAVHISGSVAEFANLMNQRAAELGCKNTHFTNANGLPDENHYTTAYDMALIFREAIKNETFLKIIGMQGYEIPPTNMTAEARQFSTHHSLLSLSAPEHYDGCFGGKTGNTSAAKGTLVSGATRNGMTLIVVSMRAEGGEPCQDHINLFNYGFDNFMRVEVPGGSVVIPNTKSIDDLQQEDTVNENVTESVYYYGDHYYVGKGIVVASTPEPTVEVTETPSEELIIQEAEVDQELTDTEKEQRKEIIKNNFKYIMFALIGLVCITTIITLITGVRKNKKARKRRKNKKKR